MPDETFSEKQIPGQLIILNGASSAGKSSIAKILQEKLDGDFCHVVMDTFMNELPPRSDPDRQRVIDDRLKVLADFVGEHLERSQNVILDIVARQKDIALYEKHQPYLIAINPSLEVLKAREEARGDRGIGTAESQIKRKIHEGISYDLEIDNSLLTAEQAADKIIEACAKTRVFPAKPPEQRTDIELHSPRNERA